VGAPLESNQHTALLANAESVLVRRDQLPISHLENDLTSNIPEMKTAARDLGACPSAKISSRHEITEGKGVHSESSPRIDTRPTASTSLQNIITASVERESSTSAEPVSTNVRHILYDEVQLLLQRAESLRLASVSDGPQISELQRRLRELAPPEEVLHALQEILRVDNEVNTELPEYGEERRH
jgi:hypothetical protein